MGIFDKWDISIPSERTYSYVKANNSQGIFLDRIGRKAIVTDFAILLGTIYSKDITNLSEKTGCYWLKQHNGSYIYAINSYGNKINVNPQANNLSPGVRPLIEFYNIRYDKYIYNIRKNDNNIARVLEYGHYPQTAVSKDLQKKLEQAYKNHNMFKTNIRYEVPESFKNFEINNHNRANNIITKFSLKVYEYQNEIYVRMPVHKDVLLSNGLEYCSGDYVWIKVEPIIWLNPLIDGNDYMISEKILFGGIPYVKGDLNPMYYKYLDPDDPIDKNIKLTPELKEQWFYNCESEINKFIKNYWKQDILKVKNMKNSYEYRQRKLIKKDDVKTEITNKEIDNQNENKKVKILSKFFKKI